MAPIWLAAVLTLGAAVPAAAADDLPHGDDEVSISVTIDERDPCAERAPGCVDGSEGGLASTGLAAGSAIGVGLALAGIGVGAYAVVRRRRRSATVRP